jgi:ATP-dependent helicase HepA
MLFVIEPVAPPALHLDRFLPATPVRSVVDATGRDVSADVQLTADDLETGSIFPILDNARIKNNLLPSMLEKGRQHAATRAGIVTSEAAKKMQSVLAGEIERLRDLKKMNDHIRDDEIVLIESQFTALTAHIAEAPLRLDAVRLIWQTPKT